MKYLWLHKNQNGSILFKKNIAGNGCLQNNKKREKINKNNQDISIFT